MEHSACDEDFPSTSSASVDLNLQTNNSLFNELQTSANNTVTQFKILDGQFFEVITSTGNKIAASCKMCKSIIKGSTFCNSNFKTHLKRKHGEECLEEYNAYKKKGCKKTKSSAVTSAVSLTSTKPNLIYQQTEFDRHVVKYFIDSMISLRCIENKYFIDIINNLKDSNSLLKIMSRRSLGRKIQEYFNEQCEEIKEQLDKTKYVATTIDIWSGRQRSFLGITAHWIETSTFRRASRALACRRFSGTHSSNRIYDMIMEIYEKFNLTTSKVVATTTDNASNFVKAFKDQQAETDMTSDCTSETDEEEYEFKENPINTDDLFIHINNPPLHIRCAAHTFNLCVTADVKKILEAECSIHQEVIKKCNQLWKASKRPKTAEIIKQILGHALSKPVETRWNSLFDSLTEIQKIKDKSTSLFKALSIKNQLRDKDYEYIDEYLRSTKPIAQAIDIIQGESNMYYGALLPVILTVKKKLELLKNEKLIYCMPLVIKYISSIENRFKNIIEVNNPQAEYAILASMSHPKFSKLNWLSMIDETKFVNMKNFIINVLSKNIKSEEKDEKILSSCSHPLSVHQKEEDEFFYIVTDLNSPNTDQTKPKADMIYSHFLIEKGKELNILNNYREIKELFIKYNTPLPSSAPVERMFSYATMTNCPKANKLSDEMFEQRVVLKTNLNYEQKEN